MPQKPPDGIPPAKKPVDTYGEAAPPSTVTGEHRVKPPSPNGATAPEVSQGAWRDRVFTPRAVMSREEMLSVLKAELGAVAATNAPLPALFSALETAWLPVLRQALEQAGGDGLDAWLSTALKPPGRVAKVALLTELVKGVERLRAANEQAAWLASAEALIATVGLATQVAPPSKLSFKVLERELEGKLEIHELLRILFASVAELNARRTELTSTMEVLRAQLNSMPGAKPDGLYSNFGRLKTEARLIDAELRRRG